LNTENGKANGKINRVKINVRFPNFRRFRPFNLCPLKFEFANFVEEKIGTLLRIVEEKSWYAFKNFRRT
jgi:hypothetical protein